MKRRFLFVIAAFVLMALGVAWCWQKRARISEAEFERICFGMTEKEVERIIGGPAGDYTYYQIGDVVVTNAHLLRKADRDWLGDEGRIRLWFKDDRVVGKEFVPSFAPAPTLVDRLLWWLPWW